MARSLIIRRPAVDPANNGIFLGRAQCGSLWHDAGRDSRTDPGTGSEYFSMCCEGARAIGAAGCMTTRHITSGLYDRIYISSKTFIGYGAAINRSSATTTAASRAFTTSRNDQGNTGYRKEYNKYLFHVDDLEPF
jgi:hypothetical protein